MPNGTATSAQFCRCVGPCGARARGDAVRATRRGLGRLGQSGHRYRRLLPMFALVLLVGLLAACDAPQSTTDIAGSHNEELWLPYRVTIYLAAIVFVIVLVLTIGF